MALHPPLGDLSSTCERGEVKRIASYITQQGSKAAKCILRKCSEIINTHSLFSVTESMTDTIRSVLQLEPGEDRIMRENGLAAHNGPGLKIVASLNQPITQARG